MDFDEQDGAPAPPGVLDALRDGWHSLGGGDAARCPGCPVCRLSESAGRMDPATAEHLQRAVGHVVSAGRELLAALAPASRPVDDAPGPAGDPVPDPPTAAGPPRTRIHVHPPATRPDPGNEEQE